MGQIRETVFALLIVSASAAVVSMFLPDNSKVSGYVRFIVGLVVTSVLLMPLYGVLKKLPEIGLEYIEPETKEQQAILYTDAIIEEACENIELQLTGQLEQRFGVKPIRIEAEGNGDIEDFLIEKVFVYYSTDNMLLYSDTQNYIKSQLGDDCEVSVMHENPEP